MAKVVPAFYSIVWNNIEVPSLQLGKTWPEGGESRGQNLRFPALIIGLSGVVICIRFVQHAQSSYQLIFFSVSQNAREVPGWG